MVVSLFAYPFFHFQPIRTTTHSSYITNTNRLNKA